MNDMEQMPDTRLQSQIAILQLLPQETDLTSISKKPSSRFATFGAIAALALTTTTLAGTGCGDPEPEFVPEPGGPTANNLQLPPGFQDWPFIGVTRRTDNGTIRVITGNSIAVEAARAGNTDPWPNGSILADLVWAQSDNPLWADMYGPGNFNALVTMHKNAENYEEDGGWAYGLWAGQDLLPSDNVMFDRDCVMCHMEFAPDNDDVFMRVAEMPNPGAAASALSQPNGLTFPDNFADWRVIGVADREPDNGTIRVVLGNDIAVDAARSGTTNPWPEGSIIADVVWDQGQNPDSEDMVAPTNFKAVALMEKDSTAFAATGNWGYGIWTGRDLAESTAPDHDAACYECHNDNAAGNDFVFTAVGQLPGL